MMAELRWNPEADASAEPLGPGGCEILTPGPTHQLASRVMHNTRAAFDIICPIDDKKNRQSFTYRDVNRSWV